MILVKVINSHFMLAHISNVGSNKSLSRVNMQNQNACMNKRTAQDSSLDDSCDEKFIVALLARGKVQTQITITTEEIIIHWCKDNK